jgi:hypothetical protein
MNSAALIVEPIDDEPHLEIRDWSFVEVRRGAQSAVHMVGTEPNMDGYVSDELVATDPVTWRFRTTDGTVLQLVDERGTTLSADYAVGRWRRANDGCEVRDVTLDVVAEIRRHHTA